MPTLDNYLSWMSLFLEEAKRVLRPDGRFCLLQSVHEVTGPGTAVRMFAHKVKDVLDSRVVKEGNLNTPKHMNEFKKLPLLETLRSQFTVVEAREYASDLYSPKKLFVSMRPLK